MAQRALHQGARMKTHEHALLSLAYGGGIALAAGNGVADPWVYVSALVGGEIIDLVDHPLYHLVYNRNEPHVVEARKLFMKRKWRQAASYLNEVEDSRGFRGLILHNVYSMTAVAALAIVLSVFPLWGPYPLIFVGAFLLHMLTDVFGDFRVLGHADNWLWVLPDNFIRKAGRLGVWLVYAILIWGIGVISSFVLVSLRAGGGLGEPASRIGFVIPSIKVGSILAYVPLMILSGYFLVSLALSAAHRHKYRLELGITREKGSYNFEGSLSYLRRLLFGQIKGTPLNLERVVLRMQSDITWAFIVAALIVVVLLSLTLVWGNPSGWSAGGQVFFLLIPVFLALFFGTFIHTTVGEMGGAMGVLAAWLSNLILGHLGLMKLWDVGYGYYLFVAAMGAWGLGLIGGIVLKGQSRMSLAVFCMEVDPGDDIEDPKWMTESLKNAFDGLQEGYEATHQLLFGKEGGKEFVSQHWTSLVMAPYRTAPIYGEDYYHIQAEDSYVPALREMAYLLCENRWRELNPDAPEYGHLPVMPRHRVLVGEGPMPEMVLEGVSYKWLSKKRTVVFRSAKDHSDSPETSIDSGLIKSWGEVLDNMLTRKSTFQTDIFIFPAAEDKQNITICGITRECTSTKEYATVEAETYSCSAMNSVRARMEASPLLKIRREASARFFYPRTSFFDQELVEWAETTAALPSEHGGFLRSDLSFIERSLAALPDKNFLPGATADFKKKAVVLGVQYSVAALVGAFNFDPLVRKFIKDIIASIFG